MFKYRIEIRKVRSEDQRFEDGEEFVTVKPDKAHLKVSSIFRMISATFTSLYLKAKTNEDIGEAREQIKAEQ